MIFKKLEKEDLVEDNLETVCKLIYQTDPYIYPALFNTEKNAIMLLGKIIPTNTDEMFSIDNMYVAVEDGKIIALILWKKGSMDWNKKLFEENAKKTGVTLPDTFELVCKEYFDSYCDESLEGIVSLINVCVLKEFRGKRVAQKMLEAFFCETNAAEYELFCLEENISALRLYGNLGFNVVTRQKAFTVNNDDVYSVRMIRKIQKDKGGFLC